jgi:ankyrin repeat protein
LIDSSFSLLKSISKFIFTIMSMEIALTGATLEQPNNKNQHHENCTAANNETTTNNSQLLLVTQPVAHTHGTAHCNHVLRPQVSLKVAACELVKEHPDQVFSTLLYIVKMGPFSLFMEVVEAYKNHNTNNDQQYQAVGTSNTTSANEDKSSAQSSLPSLNSLLQQFDAHGHSLLHWAAKRADCTDFCVYLKPILGNEPSTEDTKMTPLHWACTEPNNLAIVKLLLADETSANGKEGANNANATTTNTTNSMIEVKDGTGCTPLLLAAQHGQVETCALLLVRGANRQAQDRSRDSATHWAAYKGMLYI